MSNGREPQVKERSAFRKTPQLRVILTDKCNLSCVHCRIGGEGRKTEDRELTHQQLIDILQLCADIGFSHVKFTGGEPLLRPDAIDLIQSVSGMHIFEDVQLVTNGHFLKDKVKRLRESDLSLLTISLDAVDDRKYIQIRGSSGIPAFEALEECCREGIPVRINMVVTKNSYDQIPLMIDVAARYGCSVKLLDLICLQGQKTWRYWKKEYLHFDKVRQNLLDLGAVPAGIEEAPGGIGAPLGKYEMPNHVVVLLKDSTRGTFYHTSCKDCKYYPCQDAMISVRLTADGYLKRCLIRDDNLVPLLVNRGGKRQVLSAIKDSFEILCESVYQPFAWKPESLNEGFIE